MTRKPISDDEKKAVILRTTADVVADVLPQLNLCASNWPKYKKLVDEVTSLSEKLIDDARGFGFIGKK